jgi:hypothetical protein
VDRVEFGSPGIELGRHFPERVVANLKRRTRQRSEDTERLTQHGKTEPLDLCSSKCLQLVTREPTTKRMDIDETARRGPAEQREPA